jgi:hypothetical protein
MLRRLAGALITALLLSGCTSPGEDPGDDPGDEPSATRLTVVLDETGDGATRTFTLTCDPSGGDHPDAEAACAALDAGGVAAFAPTPTDVGCTEQWGGPQVATVDGTVDGERVIATFTRTNGCEISRWDTLAPLLGSTGGAQ